MMNYGGMPVTAIASINWEVEQLFFVKEKREGASYSILMTVDELSVGQRLLPALVSYTERPPCK